jgi:hypothetical protein
MQPYKETVKFASTTGKKSNIKGIPTKPPPKPNTPRINEEIRTPISTIRIKSITETPQLFHCNINVCQLQ